VPVEGAKINCSACPASGQKTSSHGVPAISAARIVGDHNMSRPVARRRFQRSTTASASSRATWSALNLLAPALMPRPRVLTPMLVSIAGPAQEVYPAPRPSSGLPDRKDRRGRRSFLALGHMPVDEPETCRIRTKACNYGRACGYLTVDGQDAGDVLIAENLAHPLSCGKYSCPKRQPWCPLVPDTEDDDR
jgi:hypothetical protein